MVAGECFWLHVFCFFPLSLTGVVFTVHGARALPFCLCGFEARDHCLDARIAVRVDGNPGHVHEGLSAMDGGGTPHAQGAPSTTIISIVRPRPVSLIPGDGCAPLKRKGNGPLVSSNPCPHQHARIENGFSCRKMVVATHRDFVI